MTSCFLNMYSKKHINAKFHDKQTKSNCIRTVKQEGLTLILEPLTFLWLFGCRRSGAESWSLVGVVIVSMKDIFWDALFGYECTSHSHTLTSYKTTKLFFKMSKLKETSNQIMMLNSDWIEWLEWKLLRYQKGSLCYPLYLPLWSV